MEYAKRKGNIEKQYKKREKSYLFSFKKGSRKQLSV